MRELTYALDDAGNRESDLDEVFVTPTSVTAHTYTDAANRYTSRQTDQQAAIPFIYDGRGNCVFDGRYW